MKNVKLTIFVSALLVSLWANAGNLLKNGNMESQGAWLINYLNTPDTQKPNISWGSPLLCPSAGVGNSLHVTGSALVNGNSQVAFYQKVTLSSDSVYSFNAAFKYLKLDQSWCEVFIGNEPVSGSDYGDAMGTKIANFGSWDNPLPVADGTFKLNAACRNYSPITSGEYYFIIKMGTTTWDGTQKDIDISVDELSLVGSVKQATPKLIGGGLLKNADMESQGAWQVSFLNTPDSQKPTISWGSSTMAPSAGRGNSLHVSGSAVSNGNSQAAFYQKVTLSADSTYLFNAAFRFSKLEQSWCEVFVGQEPVAGSDYGDALGKKIANFGSWDSSFPVSDGTFKDNSAACIPFKPATSGDYFFIIKMGSTTWDGTKKDIDISVDELIFATAEMTAINTIFTSNIRVYSLNNRLKVDGAKNSIKIYTTNGQLIQSSEGNNQFISSVLMKGIYLVQVDGIMKKVIVH